jgi:hypothetical protein
MQLQNASQRIAAIRSHGNDLIPLPWLILPFEGGVARYEAFHLLFSSFGRKTVLLVKRTNINAVEQLFHFHTRVEKNS